MINLILRNSPNSFQSSCAIKSALSDFHKMFVTDMKIKFEKLKDNLIPYRVYKNFPNHACREHFLSKLYVEKINLY